MVLAFTVWGVAQPKGSMTAYVPKGMHFPIVTASNRNVKSWQQLVAQGASEALERLPPDERGLLLGPVRLTIGFYLPCPKKFHPKRRRGVPVAHLTAPDVDKLARGIFDSLTHVVYHDDAQVVEAIVGKFYAGVDESPHVTIRVEPTAGVQPLAVAPAPLPLFELAR